MRTTRPTDAIDGFFDALDGRVKLKKPLMIGEINDVAAAWTSRPGGE